MFPGQTTKLSEETIASGAIVGPKADLTKLTGTTTIENILPSFGGGFSGIVCLVPLDGNIVTTTTGNIPVAVTMPQNRVTVLVYSKKENKFYPGAIS